MVEIIVATITGIFGLLGAWVAHRKVKSLQNLTEQQQEEIQFRSRALSVDLSDWGKINQEVRKLMDETCIDRFFILNAFNGYHDPRWTTAIYQVQKENTNIVSYVHFGIDDHYVSLLKKVIKEGHTSVVVDDIPESIIKAVYHSEGVLASEWHYITDRKLDTGAVGITYCSFSTRSASEIQQWELDRCAVLVAMIKGAINV
jgi:hypothetical protein